jgi:hypothetical protein
MPTTKFFVNFYSIMPRFCKLRNVMTIVRDVIVINQFDAECMVKRGLTVFEIFKILIDRKWLLI